MKKVNEDLADLAMRAEMDHEVQMARSQLYKTAKYAIKLHEMLKGVSESEGLDGWVQAKITKAADYLGAVYHHLDYEMKFESAVNENKQKVKNTATCGCGSDCKHCGGKHTLAEVGKTCKCCGNKIKEKTQKNEAFSKKDMSNMADLVKGVLKNPLKGDKEAKKANKKYGRDLTGKDIKEAELPKSKKVLKLVIDDLKKFKAEKEEAKKQGYDEDVRMMQGRIDDMMDIANLIKDGGPIAALDTSVQDLIVDYYEKAGEPLPFANEDSKHAEPEDPNSMYARLMGDISEIQNGALDGNDMADDIADELGDYLRNGDAPEGSHYEEAISIVMDALHDGPDAQAEAAEEAISFLHMEEEKARGNPNYEEVTDESGLQRHIGIKKYGKKGFEELQKAGREGANEKEKGAIKDKHLKKDSYKEAIAQRLFVAAQKYQRKTSKND